MNDRDETVFVNYDKIKKEETPLEQAYKELGKAYYEGGFEEPLPQLLPLFDKITRLKKEEEEKTGFCPGCGRKIKDNATFCGGCGYRLK